MTIVDIMTHGMFDAEVECNVVYHCVNVSQSPPITCHIASQHTLENREYQLNYIVRMLRCNILDQVGLYFSDASFESGYRRHRKRIMKPFKSVCPKKNLHRNSKAEPSVICQYVCQSFLFVQPIRS